MFQVTFWNTFNEPALFCGSGFSGGHAPALMSSGIGEYLCTHHVLLAHARAYHMYRDLYYDTYKGKVGIALNTGHTWPKDPTKQSDIEAADRAYQFHVKFAL